jgi:ABC-2 type transport system permease protein
MVTGVAFLLGSIGKDLLSVMAWGVLVMIVLFIPALGVAVPGLASSWSQLIPSYHLVDTVYNVTNLGAGWGDVAANLLWLAVWAVVFLWVGVVVLRRRFR